MEGTSENQDGREVRSKETIVGRVRSRLDLIDTGQYCDRLCTLGFGGVVAGVGGFSKVREE